MTLHGEINFGTTLEGEIFAADVLVGTINYAVTLEGVIEDVISIVDLPHFILLEDAFFLLLEDGDQLELEQ